MAGAGLAAPAVGAAPTLALSGRYKQGGFAFGRTTPRARVSLDGEDQGVASSQGLFVVGFDRDASERAEVVVRTAEGAARHTVLIDKTDYDIQNITGVPQNTVTPSGEALLARIRGR